MGYVLRDVLVVLGLAAAAARVDSWLVWPLYWAAQGTMFWALFVLGHDWCGPLFTVRTQFDSFSLKLQALLTLPLVLVFAVDTGASRATRSSTAWSATYSIPPFLFHTTAGMMSAF
jgi:hypothetical protein